MGLKNQIKELIIEVDRLKSKENKSEESILKPGEKLLSINFLSNDQKISNYSIPCKNTDVFVKLEEKLNQDFIWLKNKKYYFLNRGNVIERFKTIEENNIQSNDIIQIDYEDF